mmetsp:Transcript_30502/g.68895  ORF Transcript_30502/g.68895 Transcript_30502/m.68895 type:complete len:412 (-) Transcript_30502:67-1302(-)
MVFNNEELFSSCSGRSLPGYELTKETYEQVWDSLTRWIRATFESKNQGVNIPHFVRITWAGGKLGARKSEEAVELGRRASAESVGVARPHVCISEYFIHQYGIRYRKPAELPEAKSEEINFAKLAISYSGSLTKDVIATALKRMINAIGEAIREGKEVEISFGVGRLFGRRQQATFLMESQYLPDGVSMRSASTSHPFSSPSKLPSAASVESSRVTSKSSKSSQRSSKPLKMVVGNSGKGGNSSLMSNQPIPEEQEDENEGRKPRQSLRERDQTERAELDEVNNSRQVGTTEAVDEEKPGTKASGREEQVQEVRRNNFPALPLTQEKLQKIDLDEATNLTPGAKRRIERWLQDDNDHPQTAKMDREDEQSYRPSPSSSPMLSLRSSLRPSTASTQRSLAAMAASAQMRYKI